jgi:hypothetical protein
VLKILGFPLIFGHFNLFLYLSLLFFCSLGVDILFLCTYAASALNRVFHFSCFALSRFKELHLLVWLFLGTMYLLGTFSF